MLNYSMKRNIISESSQSNGGNKYITNFDLEALHSDIEHSYGNHHSQNGSVSSYSDYSRSITPPSPKSFVSLESNPWDKLAVSIHPSTPTTGKLNKSINMNAIVHRVNLINAKDPNEPEFVEPLYPNRSKLNMNRNRPAQKMQQRGNTKKEYKKKYVKHAVLSRSQSLKVQNVLKITKKRLEKQLRQYRPTSSMLVNEHYLKKVQKTEHRLQQEFEEKFECKYNEMVKEKEQMEMQITTLKQQLQRKISADIQQTQSLKGNNIYNKNNENGNDGNAYVHRRTKSVGAKAQLMKLDTVNVKQNSKKNDVDLYKASVKDIVMANLSRPNFKSRLRSFSGSKSAASSSSSYSTTYDDGDGEESDYSDSDSYSQTHSGMNGDDDDATYYQTLKGKRSPIDVKESKTDWLSIFECISCFTTSFAETNSNNTNNTNNDEGD